MMPVKKFKSTNTEQTVELINHQWMVRERTIGDKFNWRTISGPFETMSQAIDSIFATPDINEFDSPEKTPEAQLPSEREVINNK